MCHEVAESQLGGPSMEHLRSSSEAGETWIRTDSIPAVSASRSGEPDFLDRRERIPALQQLKREMWSALNWFHPWKISGNSFCDNLQAQKCIMLKLDLIMGMILFRLPSSWVSTEKIRLEQWKMFYQNVLPLILWFCDLVEPNFGRTSMPVHIIFKNQF